MGAIPRTVSDDDIKRAAVEGYSEAGSESFGLQWAPWQKIPWKKIFWEKSLAKVPWKKIGNFLLCWLGWWLFCLSVVSVPKMAYYYATNRYFEGVGFAGPTALFASIAHAFFLTLWWLLVIKRR